MTPRRAGRPSPCKACGRPLDPFGRCRRRTCPRFGKLWADDWYQVLLRNLQGLEHVALVTITAPGVNEGLPWDRAACSHGPEERCSGTKGCKVVEAAASQWNRSAAKRLARLHRAAYSRVRRDLGPGPIKGAQVWEEQLRGVKHVHLVVDYRPGRPRARADAYVRAVKDLAPRYLWGYADLRQSFDRRGGIRAAAYLAKYVSKATAESMDVTRPVYVGQHLTSETGVTMRFCRMKRYAWYLSRSLPIDPEEAAHRLLAGDSLGDIVADGNITISYLDQPPPSVPLAS